MSAIFTISDYTCAPATITYDDDDNLINVVMNLGSKGTYTYKTDNNPSGNLHPFAGQIFYNDIDTVSPGDYAVAYNDRIVAKKSNEGDGDWSISQRKTEPRRPKAPASSAGDY
ncbi:unnamed protein product [Rhizoctonia solani]|uniref:Uncharacterized protein n=1 Tax=Rhizoctonia solani TaxID=456999 RepID=A0A8H2W6U5_9AGAM|nr:unnamed protein product [Rhizoctonia solani]